MKKPRTNFCSTFERIKEKYAMKEFKSLDKFTVGNRIAFVVIADQDYFYNDKSLKGMTVRVDDMLFLVDGMEFFLNSANPKNEKGRPISIVGKILTEGK